MNSWVWLNIGRPVWLTLHRNGFNRDLRRLFFARYTQLMKNCLKDSHARHLDEAFPGVKWPGMSAQTRDMLLHEAGYGPQAWRAILVLISGHGWPSDPANIRFWTDPEATWTHSLRQAGDQFKWEEWN